jgi:hypothetical protein
MASRRASHGLLALSGFLLLTAGGAAQTPRDASGRVIQVPVGTASISGIVVSADSGRPLRKAQLVLNSQPTDGGGGQSVGRATVTDDQGQFSFGGLPAGQFTLDANRDQYLPSSYGQKKPGRPGTPIDLGAAQHLQISIPMTRGGVITGMVVDEVGEPLMGARVRAMRFVLVNGFRRLRSASEARTDDRGVYRVFGLEPGEYLVSGTQPLINGANGNLTFTVSASANQTQGDMIPMRVEAIPEVRIDQQPFAPTFYPGVTSPGSAQHISVDGGVERSGVDIRLLPIRTGIIQGVVSGANDPNVRVQVLLQNTDASAEPTTMTTNASPTGEFTLAGVQPGSYMVYAQTLPSQPQPVMIGGQRIITASGDVRTTNFARLHGRTPVIVDGERPSTVVITLAPGRPISGHVTYDLRQAPSRGVATTISIAPIPQNPQLPAFSTSPQTTVDADGNFTLPGIRPGRYILRASGPGTLKSAMWSGQDTLDVGLEVTVDTDVSGVELTMTDRPSTLSGTITNADGKPAMDTTIVVAPTNSGLWRNGSRRIATTRPTTDGRYVIRGLPAGEYSLAAVTDIEAGEQFDPEFLRALVGASVTVTITDGGTTTQGLRTGR